MNIENKIVNETWCAVNVSLNDPLYHAIAYSQDSTLNVWLSVWGRVRSSVGDSILVSARNTVDNRINDYEY